MPWLSKKEHSGFQTKSKLKGKVSSCAIQISLHHTPVHLMNITKIAGTCQSQKSLLSFLAVSYSSQNRNLLASHACNDHPKLLAPEMCPAQSAKTESFRLLCTLGETATRESSALPQDSRKTIENPKKSMRIKLDDRWRQQGTMMYNARPRKTRAELWSFMNSL